MKTAWLILFYAIIATGCALIIGAIGLVVNPGVAASAFIGAWVISFGALWINAGASIGSHEYDKREYRRWHEIEDKRR